MISTHRVIFAYNDSNAFEFPDISCKKGDQWLIIGRSGCGKTTLLHIMAGLLKPGSGKVVVNDIDITALSPSQTDRVRGKEIGIIFQIPHFIQSLTVLENLLVARYLAGLKEDRQQAMDILEKLNIAGKSNVKPNQLSQGEQQRLSIARALINEPSVILADEPTSSLDDHNCKEALGLLKEHAESSGSSLLIVTHDHRLDSYFPNVINLD